MLRVVSCPEIQLGVGSHSELIRQGPYIDVNYILVKKPLYLKFILNFLERGGIQRITPFIAFRIDSSWENGK